MGALVALAWSVAMLLAGAGIGGLARELAGAKREPPTDALLVDVALGLGAASLLLFALLSVAGAAGVVAALALLAFAAMYGISSLARYTRTAAPSGWGAAQVVGVLLVVALALAALVPALAPPSMSDWDSLAYHLSVPKLYLQHGGIYYINWMSHSNFPLLTEMLYAPGVAMNLPAAAKLMHYWTGVLLVAAVWMLTRRHFSEKAAPLAAIGVAGMPIVLWEATTAYVDLATALYSVVAVHLLLNYVDTGDRRHLIGCATAAGFSASTKMTGLALMALLGIWLLANPILRPNAENRELPRPNGERVGVRGIGPRLRPALQFAAVALLVCSPWYIKTWVYTGNPVYPFFYSILGGRDWTPELARNYSMLQSKFGLGHDFAAFAFLPFNLTFNSWAFYDTPGLYVGPIMLVSAPVLFAARYADRKLAGLLAFFLAQVVIWFVLTQQSRYLIPALAVLAVLGAVVVYRIDRLRLARGAMWGAFVLTAAFGIWTLWPAIRSAAPYVFGTESADDYLSRTLDIYPAQQWMNDYLPGDAKVALYGDTRGFYLERDYVWADPGHNKAFSRRFGSVDSYVRHLLEQGVTHAMVNYRFFPARKDAKANSRLVYQAIDRGLFRQLYSTGHYPHEVTVYSIR